ncbi:MAG: hypothetical protein HY898_34010 [Deltaproteobacteria bacterium]|nr:hypothetical protein [Deltaproteobacteria bacterium]
MLCVRFPDGAGARLTRVWVADSSGLEWRPTAFPASFQVPFDKQVFVEALLGDQVSKDSIAVTRQKPVVEVVITLQDVPSLYLFGYRWKDLPKQTGLRPIEPVRADEPKERVFQWTSVMTWFVANPHYVVVDTAGRVFRGERPNSLGPEQWWLVGTIEPGIVDLMKALRDQAVKAEMIRIDRSECDDCSHLGVRVYGAPSTPRDGVALALGGETDTQRRACPATDVLVPWILQLMETAPYPRLRPE